MECGDLPFLIKRDGTWMYRGSPIGRKELVCLFASVLKREADGRRFRLLGVGLANLASAAWL